jgi:hypothetical protein
MNSIVDELHPQLNYQGPNLDNLLCKPSFYAHLTLNFK